MPLSLMRVGASPFTAAVRWGCRSFSSYPPLQADFENVVIGAGVVGLAIAARLASRPGNPATLLLERHESAGTETSSRNSEVVHAGLYYPPGSLKAELCVRGKHALYALCEKQGIPYRRMGKWIVAQKSMDDDDGGDRDGQEAALHRLHKTAKELGVPTRFLTLDEARQREPDVQATAAVLESPSTGIVDSHALMMHLEGEFQAAGGQVAYHTAVDGIRSLGSDSGYEIRTRSVDDDNSPPPLPPEGSASASTSPSVETEEEDEEDMIITTSNVINSAGLSAIAVSNALLPPERRLIPRFAKGTYFSYAASRPRPGVLVYPAPAPGKGGLGTHLTLDLSTPPRVRFGPDVEWVDDPGDLTPNPARMADAVREIRSYLPAVDADALTVDYCGIRPKLAGPEARGFQDFIIRKEEGFAGFVNLLGIESPGLTSSLAIAELVERLLYQ